MNLWCSIPEISLCFGLILIILYGLFSMSAATEMSSGVKIVNMYSSDVYLFSSFLPLTLLIGYCIEGIESGLTLTLINSTNILQNSGIDILLIILTIIILQSFKSLETNLLIILAFIAQLFMIHSCDLVSFYICLEAQNFCFLVLCGLQPRINPVQHISNTNKVTAHTRNSRPLAGVEATIKYLLLSAFSSGVLLFWFSVLYLRTGISSFGLSPLTSNMLEMDSSIIPQMMMLVALMFKLGGAPLHIWMVDIYSGVKRTLLMYISTAPKLSLFGFWISTWHSVWTDFTVFLFVALSMIIGCFGAYNQPTLRALFAFSTVNEIGLMLMAVETAGFHSLFQHLSIYIITMLLLWNLNDKRIFSIIAVSLAGMPPLAGFFGKAWIFNSVATTSIAGPYLALLVISLFCTLISLVYYLRVFRLFTMAPNNSKYAGNTSNILNTNRIEQTVKIDSSIKLTSFCVMFLFFAPVFYLKPFVL